MENSTIQSKARYNWIDNIKAAACILVVLGHFFMSMKASGLISGGTVFNYFVNTIYTFHVQLFFVCSRFLYQKSNRVHSLKSWRSNALDKLLNLGVPYFTFSLATLVLKILFPDNLTTQATPWTLGQVFSQVRCSLFLPLPAHSLSNSKPSANSAVGFQNTLCLYF